MPRLLLDPLAPAEGSGATPPAAAVAAAPAQTQTAVSAAPPVPGKPQAVTVPYEQFERFLAAELSAKEAERRDKERAAEAERMKAEAQIKQGQAEKAVETIREQHTRELADERKAKDEISERSKKFVRDKELAVACAGLPFVSPFAAKQFLAMVGPRLEAYPEGETFTVRTATFQSPEQLIAEARNDPQYAHFFAASTTGGAKPANSNLTAPTPPAATNGEGPKNLGEAILSQWNQHHSGRPAVGAGLSRRRISN